MWEGREECVGGGVSAVRREAGLPLCVLCLYRVIYRSELCCNCLHCILSHYISWGQSPTTADTEQRFAHREPPQRPFSEDKYNTLRCCKNTQRPTSGIVSTGTHAGVSHAIRRVRQLLLQQQVLRSQPLQLLPQEGHVVSRFDSCRWFGSWLDFLWRLSKRHNLVVPLPARGEEGYGDQQPGREDRDESGTHLSAARSSSASCSAALTTRSDLFQASATASICLRCWAK